MKRYNKERDRERQREKDTRQRDKERENERRGKKSGRQTERRNKIFFFIDRYIYSYYTILNTAPSLPSQVTVFALK